MNNQSDAPVVQMDPKLKYKIKTRSPIGEGAFSTVYHAVDKTGAEYAIKCISLKKIENYNIDKFLLELKISTVLKHPNIVKSYEVFKTAKNWYIVTEYCSGGTLLNIMKKLNNLTSQHSDKELICNKYLTQLRHALKYLYKSNIVHRDLKPANILIAGNNNDILKLADFGFSRYFNSEEGTQETQEFMMTSFCGTPLYMAPELLINKKYNNKADLWSFGVIMYEMLYGTNPYNYPKNLSNLLDLIQTKEITYENVYSDQCLNLLKSLLQTDPKNRIDWKDFFRHQWFDKQIPSGFSKDSLYGSMENLNPEENISSTSSQNPQFPVEKNSSPFDTVSKTELVLGQVNINDDDNEYEVINISELNPCDYQSCREEENNKTGIVQILSNSVNSVKRVFGFGKRVAFGE
jgi:serine/threonine protein kinase